MAGLWYLGQTVAASLGQAAGNAFILLLCCQFHLLFYASRPLPNTLALPLVAVAIAEWMQKRASTAVCILTFTTVKVLADISAPDLRSNCLSKQQNLLDGPFRLSIMSACAQKLSN